MNTDWNSLGSTLLTQLKSNFTALVNDKYEDRFLC